MPALRRAQTAPVGRRARSPGPNGSGLLVFSPRGRLLFQARTGPRILSGRNPAPPQSPQLIPFGCLTRRFQTEEYMLSHQDTGMNKLPVQANGVK
ncbi:hypothetical protein AAFF_G00230220 [Aldrovandia affinis]|uniref:Uncharacterized protein n=1 Tax=Aldrovandia affinis TaxID=143900 RepID=A0AAD7SVQ5_9TELE|nr:hypothetical protein AAFF_G00230220 [Aldrovandia affinis]